ncbi:MAG TPA: hydroxymethylbilane synthase [Burkholderiaceae bacterium]|nr:hydroxymethylbilane synthase [Burkholderiaceae bacterium]
MSDPARLIIASRESRLAMWQAEFVQGRLRALYPGCDVQILGMTTEGDRVLDRALNEIGGKGLFTKELENALADRRADLAVHSLKDVPMELPPGFALAAILAREDPRDAFVSSRYGGLAEIPPGGRVGTSSLRRAAQIRAAHPALDVQPLRGNVNTRLAKLDRGEFDAIVLAAAGLKRLGLAERIRGMLSPADSLPAAGQGALGIEVLAGRPDLERWLAPLVHLPTLLQVSAERAVSRALGGSCRMPLAAYCEPVAGGELRLTAGVFSLDGRKRVLVDESRRVESLADALDLGDAVAADLLAGGAAALLEPAA